jgi:hypothetical protein
MIAALFVETDGVYSGLPDVDVWDVTRDARLYSGPHPVVAHPPCERWGRYWYGGPMLHSLGKRKQLGDDGGCFAHALWAVRQFGGVLEHPEASGAWSYFGIMPPLRNGGWSRADQFAWTCCVEQGAYGHRSRKATWLYAVDVDLPSMTWGRAKGDFIRLDEEFHSKAERRKSQRVGALARLPKRERAATPIPFRDVLLSIARSARANRSAV